MEYEQERLKKILHKYGAMAVIFDDGTEPNMEPIDNTEVPIPLIYDLDWLRRQMDEEVWRKLSEKERQRLLAQVFRNGTLIKTMFLKDNEKPKSDFFK